MSASPLPVYSCTACRYCVPAMLFRDRPSHAVLSWHILWSVDFVVLGLDCAGGVLNVERVVVVATFTGSGESVVT